MDLDLRQVQSLRRSELHLAQQALCSSKLDLESLHLKFGTESGQQPLGRVRPEPPRIRMAPAPATAHDLERRRQLSAIDPFGAWAHLLVGRPVVFVN